MIAERGRTGPKSLRLDDVIVSLAGNQIEVTVGTTRVGLLSAADSARYAPVLARVGCAVESSGIVLIDAEGHPGGHVKLYLPDDADMLVPANVIDPTVPLFFALDRAGGVTLAERRHDHRLIAEATAPW
ncbi:hypothetical protein [Nocardia sp. CA-119907]|uniref:hypothetical protein n=1 Tax=Nocardia sp. CA-119907 TaxID=3239973 RepID=UPI003D98CF42